MCDCFISIYFCALRTIHLFISPLEPPTDIFVFFIFHILDRQVFLCVYPVDSLIPTLDWTYCTHIMWTLTESRGIHTYMRWILDHRNPVAQEDRGEGPLGISPDWLQDSSKAFFNPPVLNKAFPFLCIMLRFVFACIFHIPYSHNHFLYIWYDKWKNEE